MRPTSTIRRTHNLRTPAARFPLRPISLAVCLLGAAPAGFALPQDAVPSFGQTTVRQTAPNQLNITQTTQRAGIDWASFSIGANERVVVTQPGTSSVLLNRVLGNDPSQIFGSLQSNGSVWLINPRGIVFGASARVDVGGLLASTLSISNDDIASGRLVLGRGAGEPGALVNEGQITAPGGNVILVAPQLTHSGRIDARRVGLAAATDVTIDVEGDGLIFFNVRNDGSLATRLSLLGNVLADGGLAEVRAAARAGFADTVLNLDGIVQARSIGQRNGRIVIDGGSDGITVVAGRLEASGSAAGERGGEITVLGQKIGITGTAVLDASGSAGGGTLLVGGDFQGKNAELRNAEMVSVLAGARLDVSATGQGDGGKLIVWSDQVTQFAGAADARGGASGGDGGFVEVSGKQHLAFTGSSDRSAAHGQAGMLLLDPKSLLIQDSGADINGSAGGTPRDIANGDLTSGVFRFNDFNAADPSIITKAGIAALTGGAGGAVTLQADDSITVAAGATLTRSGDLTLQAGKNIFVNASISSGGDLNLLANSSAGASVGTGRVEIASGVTLTSGGTLVISNDGGGATGVHQIGGDLTANTLALIGNVNLTATSTWNLSAATTLPETISGDTGAGLVKGDIGTLILTGNNTYTGTTTVSGGVLSIGGGGATGSLQSSSIVNNATLRFNRDTTTVLSVAADIGGTGNVVQAGTGTTVLSGTNTYDGTTLISAGTLQIGAGAGGGATGTLGDGAVTNNATLRLNRDTSSALTVANAISGSGAVVQAGTGTTIFSAANTYGGGTSINAGTLRVTGSGKAGDGTGAITMAAGTTLDIAGGASLSNPLTLADNASIISSSGGGALETGTAVSVGAGKTLTLSGGSGTLVIDRDINEAGANAAVAVIGGTVELRSPSSNYAGGTAVSGGATLRVDVAGVAGVGTIALADGATLDITNTATVVNSVNTLGDASITSSNGIGTLATGAAVVVGIGKTLTLSGGTGTLIFSREIDQAGANAAVAVTGGIVVLNQAGSDYAGGTAVSSGATLRVSGSGVAGVGTITLASTGVLDIAAGVSVDNSITSNGGSITSSSGTATLTGAGTLALGAGSTTTLSGGSTGLSIEREISGATGSVSTNGSVTFAADNSYGGSTTISGGTLNIGAGGATGTLGSGAVANSATLSFNRDTTTALSVAANISGSGSVEQTGSGTTILTGSNSYTGSTNINGGVLQVGAGGAIGSLGSGTVNIGAGTSLRFNRNVDGPSVDNTITGAGKLVQAGTGVTTLTGANTYSGGTEINAGTLRVTGSGKAGDAAVAITMADNTTLDIAGGASLSNPLTLADNASIISSNGGGTLAAGTAVSVGVGKTLTLSGGTGTLTFSREIDQAGANAAVAVTGGIVVLNQAGSDYAGGTAVSSGATLRVSGSGVAGVGGITLASTGVLDVAGASVANNITSNGGNITNSDGTATLTSAGTLALGAGSTSTLSGAGTGLSIERAISGATGAVSTSGSVTFAADNSYGGSTTISGGTLNIGAGGATGTLGSGAVANSATLSFNRDSTTALSVAADIGGNGNVVQAGTGTTILSGTNTYAGTTLISAGTLQIGAGASGGATGTLGNGAVTNTATLRLNRDTSSALTVANAISGTGAVEQTGSGTTVFTGNNTYSGTTLISGGVLQIGAGASGGATGTLGNGAVTNTATLRLNRDTSSALTVANAISGSGAVVQAGSGTTIFSAANTYSGGTSINAGTLRVTGSGKAGDAAVAITMAANTTLDIAGGASLSNPLTLADNASIISSSGSGTLAAGTAVSVGVGKTLTLSGGTGTLTFSREIDQAGANAAVAVTGGIVVLNQAGSDYAGGTAVSSGATLRVSGSGVAGVGGITLASTGVLDVAGASVANNITSNGGNITNSDGTATLTSAGTLALGAGSTTTLSGGSTGLSIEREISGATGSVSTNGSVTFAADNSYGGSTTISGGTLNIGAGGATGTLGSGAVANSATLSFNRDSTTALSVAADIGGNGNVVQAGTGTTILSGTNTYAGTTLISAGTLQIGAGGATGTLGNGAVTNTATLRLNRDTSSALTVANAISGSGAVVQAGSGTTIFSAANTYSGGTSINAGTLRVTGSGKAGDAAVAITMADNTTLDIAGGASLSNPLTLADNASIISSSGGGTLAAGTAVSVGVGKTLTLSGGTGTLTFSREIDQAGATAAVAVTGGIVVLNQAGSDYAGGTAVSSGATLRVSGSGVAGVGSITLASTGVLDVAGASVANNITSNGGNITNSDGTATLTSAGTLALGAGSTSTLSGAGTGLSIERAISGATGAVSTSGSVTFAADNSYGGSTTISGGTLNIGAGGATGTLGSGAVTNNGTLRFNRDTTTALSVAADIGGNGNVVQAGTGTTILSGTNTYGGTTLISSGTLQIGAGASGGATGTLGDGAVTNNATLRLNRDTSSALTVANAISGTGAVVQAGSGTTIFSAANTYDGGTSINAGTLRLTGSGQAGASSGSIAISGTGTLDIADGASVANGVTVLNGSTITNSSGTGTLAAGPALVLPGSSSLTLSSTGTELVIQRSIDASAASAAIVFGGGAVTLNTGASLTGGINIADDATLRLTGSAVTGAATIQLASRGTLDLTDGVNVANDVQTLGGGITNTSGTGTLSGTLTLLADATVSSTASGLTFAGSILGGAGFDITKAGGGSVSFTASNSYAGSTTVSAGTLVIGSGGATGSLGAGAVTNEATLRFNRDTTTTLTVANSIGGSGNVEQIGSGTTVLSGSNSYAGTTLISAGTLSIGAGGATGTLGAGAVTNSATLRFNRDTTTALSVAADIGGNGNVVQAGTGTTILSGTNTYAGTTLISAGTLQIGAGGATGTLGDGAVTNNGVLRFNRDGSSLLTVANAISGTGSLQQAGTGATVLTAGNTYSGGTSIAGGTLRVSGGSAKAGNSSGGIALAAGTTLDIAGGATLANAVTLAGSTSIVSSSGNGTLDSGTALVVGAGSTLTLDGGSGTLTLSRAVNEAGASAALRVSGGNVVLGADNGYSGGTTIAAGTLSIGAGGSIGTLGSGAITNDGTLRFNRSTGTLVVADSIGGSGNLVQTGAGSTVLGADNSYTGTTLVSAGTLQVGAGAGSGTLGSGTITNDATLRFTRSGTLTVASLITGSGNVEQTGSGTTAFTADNTYSGTTLISGGTLQIGTGGGTGAFGTGGVTNDATLRLNRSNALTISDAIIGSGSLVQAGIGTTTLLAGNAYTGGTTVENGTLQLQGTAAKIGSGNVTLLAAGTLDIAGGANIANAISSQGGTLSASSGSGTLGGSLTLTAAGTRLSGAGNLAVNGVVDDGVATLGIEKTGSGTVTLAAANTYGGGTVVSAGTLATAGAGVIADSSAVTVGTGATLRLGGNETIGSLAGLGSVDLVTHTLVAGGDNSSTSFGGTLSGSSGSFTKAGNGTLTLGGSNSHGGTTRVSGGTLVLGSSERLAAGSSISVDSGARLELTGTETVTSLTLAGTLAGTGNLAAGSYTLNSGTVASDANLGSGNLAVSGASVLNGTAGALSVNIDAGANSLTLGSANRLNGSATVNVGSGATLTLTGNQSLALLDLTGTLAGSGTLSASTYTLRGGAIANAALGSGTLNAVSGNTRINGTAAVGTLNVDGGTLTLGSAGRLTGGSGVTVAVDSDTTLVLGGNETVGTLNLSGTLGGIGSTLVATTYTLAGGTALANLGGGTFTSTGNSQLSGTLGANSVTVSSGTLTLGGPDLLSNSASVSVAGPSGSSGTTLVLGGNDSIGSLTLAGNLAGSGTLTASASVGYTLNSGIVGSGVVLGDGTLESHGSSLLNGSSTAEFVNIVDGTLTLGAAERLADDARVRVFAPATLTTDFNETVGRLSVAGLRNGSGTVSAAVTEIDGGIFDSPLGTGELISTGDSTLNSTSQASIVRVESGSLTLGGSGRLIGTPAITVEQLGTLNLGGDETAASLTLSGTLGGSGTLTAPTYALVGGTVSSGAMLGGGSLTSSGNSFLFGSAAAASVTVSSGTLTLGGVQRLASTATVNVDDGAVLALTGNTTVDRLVLLGSLQGSATLTAARYDLDGGVVDTSLGAGVLNSTGSSSINAGVGAGTVNVTGGTLTLVGANRLADAAIVNVTGGATLALGGDNSIGRLNLGSTSAGRGTLGGSGTLSAGAYSLADGTANAGLGAGALDSRGSSVINGTAAVSTLAVDEGTLTLGAAGRLGQLPATTIATGATLQLGGNEALGTLAGAGTLALGAATLSTGASGSSGFDGVIDGSGGIVKQGTGTFTLNGINAYTGSTQVQDGTLVLGSSGRLRSDSAVSVADPATLRLDSSQTVASLVLEGTLSGSGTLQATSYTLNGGNAVANLGTGTLRSSGASQLDGSAAALDVFVDGGTLTLGSTNRLADAARVTVGSSAALVLTGNDTIGTLRLDGGALTGSGTLTASSYTLNSGNVIANLGSGSLVSGGNSTLGGEAAVTALTIADGQLTLDRAARLHATPDLSIASGASLQLGGAETLGSLTGAGALALGSATLTTDTAVGSTFSGSISGSGQLVKRGSGSFTLASDQAYTGSTTVQQGTLAVGGSLASSSFAVTGGTLALQSAERLADGATLTIGSAGTATLAGNERVASLTLIGTLGGSGTLNATSYTLNGGSTNASANLGSGTLTSTGNSRINGLAAATSVSIDDGSLTLGSNGRLTATPATQVAATAQLVLGGDETIGTLSGSGGIALGTATLTSNSSSTSTFSGVIAGSGGIVKQGSGTFTLSGSNTYTGSSRVAAGTLALAGGNTLADSGAVIVDSGATLALASSETVQSLTLSGLLSGAGTLTAATTTLVGGQVDAQLGSGVLVTSGASRLNGSAAVTTLQIDDGTLTLGAANRFSATPATTVAAGATLVLGGNESLGTLAGNGGVTLGSATLSTGSAGDSTFAGVIAGSGGLVKQGSGSFTLAGANSYSGTTQVAAGTLQLQGSNILADSSAVTVASGATLAMAGTDTVASLLLQGTLAGSGTLTSTGTTTLDGGSASANLGGATLVSQGNSTLAGSSSATTVTVQGGTLTLAAADRLDNAASLTVASGATLTLSGNDQIADLLLQGTLSGSGRLAATTTTLAGGTALADLGGGTLLSSGNSTLAGSSLATSVVVNSGTLTLQGSSGRLQAAPTVNLAGGTALALGSSETIGSLSGSGSVLLGAATLATGSAGGSTFAGAISGSGGLTKQGAGDFVLSGANTYTGLTRVDAGTLTIGDGTTNGSVGTTSGFDVSGLLRSNRSDTVSFNQAIAGSGAFEQAGSGRIEMGGGNKTYTGATQVRSGVLATIGNEQLPDASDLLLTGGALVLGGNETLRSIDASGKVTLGGNLTASGNIALKGAVDASAGAVTLSGQQIDAIDDGNLWGSSLSINAGGSVSVASGRDAGGQRRNLVLGTVNAAAGGTVSAGVITLQGDTTVSGGTLSFISSAPAVATAPDADLVGKISPAQRQIAFAGDVVQQAAGSRIDVADNANLQVVADNGGSVQLLGANNRFAGGLEVRSGGAVSAWAGNVVSANFGGGSQEYSMQSHVQIAGTTVRIGGAGIEADVVRIRADKLSTAPGAVIAARLPFDNLAGTTNALPALTLELTDAAFLTSFPFGQTGGNEVAINVGSRAWGNRSLPIDSGYITVLPRNGARGATSVVLSGPSVGSYTFFFDGAGVQTEIPVFYNGVLPVTPQVSGSISATVAVSEGARKERFDDAVRTENVAVRLRAGVIAEVGPGRPATVGTEGAKPPAGCAPVAATLSCETP